MQLEPIKFKWDRTVKQLASQYDLHFNHLAIGNIWPLQNIFFQLISV